MTCYEILTGRVPFQDHPLGKQCSVSMHEVINSHLRPEVPRYVDEWARELLQWCWHSDLAARPSFEVLLSFIEDNSDVEYIQREAAIRMVALEEAIEVIPRKSGD
ncbi:hypothetical protein M758_12G108900 [Ceratodon purpureus]|nr:hypothetical protein M758_12G108900 [Ceratodon purpureus]